jgi:hypothetical protein
LNSNITGSVIRKLAVNFTRFNPNIADPAAAARSCFYFDVKSAAIWVNWLPAALFLPPLPPSPVDLKMPNVVLALPASSPLVGVAGPPVEVSTQVWPVIKQRLPVLWSQPAFGTATAAISAKHARCAALIRQELLPRPAAPHPTRCSLLLWPMKVDRGDGRDALDKTWKSPLTI